MSPLFGLILGRIYVVGINHFRLAFVFPKDNHDPRISIQKLNLAMGSAWKPASKPYVRPCGPKTYPLAPMEMRYRFTCLPARTAVAHERVLGLGNLRLPPLVLFLSHW